MILIFSNTLKVYIKQCLIVLFCALFFNGQLLAQDESFETTVPTHWSTTHGSLSTSTEHYKLGNKSLRWDWNANAIITVSNLQSHGLEPSEVTNYYYNMFRMWVYNTSAIATKPMVVEFYDNTGKLQAYYNFQLNFTGWRAASASYLHEMSGVGSSGNLSTMKIKAPNSGSGTFFFDFIDYTMSRNTMRSADYQLPFITLDNKEHWGDIMHFQSLPKLPLTTPTMQELSDLAVVKQKYDDRIKGNAPSSTAVINATNKYNALNISYVNGIVKGNPLYGQDYPNAQNIKSVDDFVLIFAKDFAHSANVASKNYFLNTIRYILDQGFADGSAMETIHHIGYSFRNIPSAVHLMKDELKAVGLWIQAQKMVEWYSAVDGIWEPTASSSNMDDANTRSIARLGACLYKSTDAEKVQYLKGYKIYLENFLTLYPMEGQGMKIDFTGFHHNTYYPGYTFLGFNSLAEVINYVSGGQFAIATNKKNVFKKSLLLARVITASGDIPNSLSGRNPFVNPPIRYGLKNLGLANPVDADLLKAHNYMYGIDSQTSTYGSELPPQGFWQVNFANLGIYRRSNWVANIKGFNKFFWGSEIYTSNNRYGRYQSYGAVEVMYKGGHGSSKFNINGWDWNKTPGATTKHLSWTDLKAATSRQDEITGSNFAASLRFGAKASYYVDSDVEGDYGVFGMDFTQKNISLTHDASFKFKKSVFCFDGKLICLGSNINSATGLVATNLFQNYLSSTTLPINVNNTTISTFPYNNTLSGASNNWIIDAANTGYFVKSGNSVVIDRKNQNSPSQTGNGSLTNGDFASAYINHATAPDNAGYEYVIIPGTNSADMAAFSRNMDHVATAFYEVIQKNNLAHIVKYNDMYGYALFGAGSYGNATPVKNNDTPCLVMAEKLDGNLTLSVVSPDLNFAANNGISQARTIQLTINGECSLINSSGGAVSVKVNTGETILTIETKNGLPVDISLNTEFTNPYYPIVYCEDFRYENGTNGFTSYLMSDGGYANASSIINRVSDVPDFTDSNGFFDPATDRPVTRIPQGNVNAQRAIATKGTDGSTNFAVDAYVVFTTLNLTEANPLINESDIYKYASFWTQRRYGDGEISAITMLATTEYTGDPATTAWTTLPLYSGRLAKTTDGLTYVKGVVNLTPFANSPKGSTVTLAYRYQGSASAYSDTNRNGIFYFSDLQFFVQSTPSSVSKSTIEADLKVFPNPTNSVLNIQILNSNIQLSTIRLIDISGKIIYTHTHREAIDVSGLAKGMYFLSIETNKGNVINEKIIVN